MLSLRSLLLVSVLLAADIGWTETEVSMPWLLFLLVIITPAAVLTSAVASRTAAIGRRDRGIAMAVWIVFLAWSLAVVLAGWPAVVERGLPLVDDVLVVAPLVLGLAAIWYVAGPRQARWSWAVHNLRLQVFLILVPVLAMFTMSDVASRLMHPEIASWVLLVAVIGLISAAPLFVGLLLPARPMDPGDLRKIIMRIADDGSVRLRNVLRWETGFRLANAAAVGLLPRLRVIILSDLLLARLTPREVEAVAAHEIAHLRHHHLPFLGATALAVLFLVERVCSGIALDGVAVVLPLVAALFGTIAVSRIFERQADASAAAWLSRQEGSSAVTMRAAMTMSSTLALIGACA
ncbi:MAG: M48 family metalloprotease, partial [Phycisphaerales bacterium]|nr:M48 family metalloprotease [Phycisphaerales bacterium]